MTTLSAKIAEVSVLRSIAYSVTLVPSKNMVHVLCRKALHTVVEPIASLCGGSSASDDAEYMSRLTAKQSTLTPSGRVHAPTSNSSFQSGDIYIFILVIP